MDKHVQYIKSIEAQNLDIDRLAPYQYYKKNTQFVAARQDGDLYFRWEASVREIH
jgi:NADH:ubiquinone oxidoreductase subunit D